MAKLLKQLKVHQKLTKPQQEENSITECNHNFSLIYEYKDTFKDYKCNNCNKIIRKRDIK